MARPSVKINLPPQLASVAVPMPVAKMEMPKLRVPISDELIQKVTHRGGKPLARPGQTCHQPSDPGRDPPI